VGFLALAGCCSGLTYYTGVHYFPGLVWPGNYFKGFFPETRAGLGFFNPINFFPKFGFPRWAFLEFQLALGLGFFQGPWRFPWANYPIYIF